MLPQDEAGNKQRDEKGGCGQESSPGSSRASDAEGEKRGVDCPVPKTGWNFKDFSRGQGHSYRQGPAKEEGIGEKRDAPRGQQALKSRGILMSSANHLAGSWSCVKSRLHPTAPTWYFFTHLESL